MINLTHDERIQVMSAISARIESYAESEQFWREREDAATADRYERGLSALKSAYEKILRM